MKTFVVKRFNLVLLIQVTTLCFGITAAKQESYIQDFQIVSSRGTFESSTKTKNRFKYLDEDHPCRRNCQRNTPPLLCKYEFVVDWYFTLTSDCGDCPFNVTDCFRKNCVPGDGTRREILTVNKRLPGPTIEVCHNDIIIVDVHNKMASQPTTIHWHGQPQNTTPYMDGVPFITQCPVLPTNSFRYTFRAAQAGTHFWHSHIGMQRVDGVFGALIVRVPKEENYHKDLYDYDLHSHVMVINDWHTQDGTEMLLDHFYSGGRTSPPSLLVNGRGRYKKFYGDKDEHFVPTARFKVDSGYRYRFRVINAGSLNCPIEVTVDDHRIEVISSDGVDIKPIKTTSLIIYSGERFDFILHANQPVDLYWIKFKGLLNCKDKETYQVAVLEYDKMYNEPLNSYPKGDVTYLTAHNHGVQVNPLNKGTENKESVVPIPRMKAVAPWDKSLQSQPDFQYYIGFDFYNISHKDLYPYEKIFDVTNPLKRILTPQFNHISMMPPSVALLSQRDELGEDVFCNKENLQGTDCIKEHCQCLHGIKIPLGSIVELVFVDEGFSFDVNHPLHLHGYHFRVVAMERVGSSVTMDEVKQKDAMGLIERNLHDAPLKDTVTVPDGGYTIVRFEANSPGYWMLHCHIEVHMVLGMAMILQVGEKQEMVAVPENFPKCGDYTPDIKELVAHLRSSSEANHPNVTLFHILLKTIISWIFCVMVFL